MTAIFVADSEASIYSFIQPNNKFACTCFDRKLLFTVLNSTVFSTVLSSVSNQVQ